jgi:hypothetical protein
MLRRALRRSIVRPLTVAALVAGATVPTVVSAPRADAAVVPAISVASAWAWEGDTGSARTMTFSVILSQPTTTTVSVNYKLVTGSASTADFNNQGGTNQLLTFSPGTTTRWVNVAITPDTLDELLESFTIQLSSPVNATIRTAMAAGRIFDDDPGTGVQVAISDAATAEGDSGGTRSMVFWISLTDPSPTPVTLHAMTADGSATETSDYTMKMMDITFAPGETKKMFSVTTKPDLTMEPNETFTVNLMTVDGATVLDGSGTGMIVSDEPVTYLTQTFRLGPFNLSAMNQPGWENEAGPTPVPRPAGAIGIKNMRFDIVDASFNPVDMHAVHLHHIVMLDQSRSDAVCPALPFNRFAGTGAERNALVLPQDYAYRVGASDQWGALWHIMNMTTTARTVYLQYTVDYVAATSNLAAKGVTTYWYDVDACWGDSEYTVPGGGGVGSVHTKLSPIYTAPRAGVRVAEGGHLHAGGIDVTLRRVASGQAVCTNVASYEAGMVHRMSPCAGMSFISAGEQFQTSARYSNEQQILGAMGIQVSYVWEM